MIALFIVGIIVVAACTVALVLSVEDVVDEEDE